MKPENGSLPTNSSDSQEIVSAKALTISILLLSLLATLRFGWVGDDAAISFRVIDNFLNGFGLRWNTFERVQVFTHPLWLLLLIPFHWITGEPFITTIIISSLLAVSSLGIILFLLCDSPAKAIICSGLWILSAAVIDYSTSGLENPLAYFLITLFVAAFTRSTSHRQVLQLSILTALIGCTRLDLLLMVLPALIAKTGRSIEGLKQALWGLIPLFLWELFSLVYFGFPFPNTAYAKLGTSIPSYELHLQGILYLIHHLWADPITLSTLLLGLLSTCTRRTLELLPLIIGQLLYLTYIVMIGGDFMAGRMLSVPCVFAIALIASAPAPKLLMRHAAFLLASLMILAYRMGTNDGVVRSGGKPDWLPFNGIIDERLYYFHGSGLPNFRRDGSFPTHGSRYAGLAFRNSTRPALTRVAIGFEGYYAGPHKKVIDVVALADPLLARMPAINDPFWRIGHFERAIPPGYLETLTSGKNVIQDPKLRQFYDQLKVITQEDIWSLKRIQTIFLMNAGHYNSLIEKERYQFPDYQEAQISNVNKPVTDGTPWNVPGTITMTNRSRIRFQLSSPQHARFIRLAVDHNDDYELHLYHNSILIKTIKLPAMISSPEGLRNHRLELGSLPLNKPISSIVVTTSSTGNAASIGYLALE